MNIISFTYTKSDGSTSNRVISPIITPSTMFEGTDLSELSAEDQVLYCQELGKLRDEYLANVNTLLVKYDLKNHYRRFDPSKMTNVVKEAV
jgi:hypothetical protein